MQRLPAWMAYPLGLILVLLAWQLGQWPWLMVLQSTTGMPLDQGQSAVFAAMKNIDPNLNLALMLFAFIVGLLALFAVQKRLHYRPVISLFGAIHRFDFGRFFFAFGLWTLVVLAMALLDGYQSPQAYRWQFQPTAFAVLVLVSVLMIPLQTAFEECLFRGYLYQGFSLLFRRPLWVVLLTGVLFGGMHALNPEVEALGVGLMAYYMGTGVFLGLIRAWDQRLELCWGFHTANNIFMALWATSSWSVFQTPALWRQLEPPQVGMEIFLSLGVIFPLVLRIFSLRYRWPSWRQALWAPTSLS